MADTVATDVLLNEADRYIVQLMNTSDGTGEAAVIKINKSDLADIRGLEPDAIDIEWIDFNVQGFASILLAWDHTTDDEIARIGAGSDMMSFKDIFAKRDPKSAGGTGDVVLTTVGAAANASYNIILSCRLRRQP